MIQAIQVVVEVGEAEVDALLKMIATAGQVLRKLDLFCRDNGANV